MRLVVKQTHRSSRWAMAQSHTLVRWDSESCGSIGSPIRNDGGVVSGSAFDCRGPVGLDDGHLLRTSVTKELGAQYGR